MIRAACLTITVLLIAPAASWAVEPAEQAFLRFQQEDKCISVAKLAHPGRDPASQKAVDAQVDTCLKEHDLPPRAHVAPQDDSAPIAGH